MPIVCPIYCTLIGKRKLLEIYYKGHFWRISYLLWVPNKGKIPANVDRVKLFAANALAEYAG